MPVKHRPIVLDTLGALISEGRGIAAYCLNRECSRCRAGRGVDLDLRMLAERLGAGHGSLHNDLAPHLRCALCGSKDIALSMQTPDPPTTAKATPMPAGPGGPVVIPKKRRRRRHR